MTVGLPHECWPWTGATNGIGYGKSWYEGKLEASHRLAFFFTFGYWPVVCRHGCDNPICCNPAHLSDGTQGDNIRDAKVKGRLRGGSSNPGERNGNAVLTESDVLLIHEARTRGATIGEIGDCFGISTSQAWLIVSGKRWSHLKRPGPREEAPGGGEPAHPDP